MTQVTFSFVVAPFIVLRLDQSLAVWASVYFYAIVGVAVSMAFFASPAKAHLRKVLEARAKAAGGGGLVKSPSTDSLAAGGRRAEPVLGMSDDPARDIDEAVQEIRGEIERAQAQKKAKKSASSSSSGEGKKGQ